MTTDDINKLAEIIGNKQAGRDTGKQVKRIFRNKKDETVIRETAALMTQLQKKERSNSQNDIIVSGFHFLII